MLLTQLLIAEGRSWFGEPEVLFTQVEELYGPWRYAFVHEGNAVAYEGNDVV